MTTTPPGAGRGTPWTLPALAGAGAVLVASLGPDRAAGVVAAATEVVFIAFFLRHLGFAIAAMRTAPEDLSAPLIETGFCPRVTVLVACKNEEAVVQGLVGSLLALDYPADRLQVVIVDDGSDDRTPELLAELAGQHDRLDWIRRAPGSGGGKSGALNAALDRATGDVIVVFDADHQPRTDVLRRLVRHFEDDAVEAVQGRCLIRNPGDSALTALVAIDYMAGYLVNEYGRQSLFALPAYGGANCAVRTSTLRAAGGWNVRTVTEDTDLTLRVLLSGGKVRYDVSAVDEEEGVVSVSRYWRQRYRWARGHQQVWRDYRRAVWASKRLSRLDKLETTMFLLVYHLPVVSAVGLAILLLWMLGLASPVSAVDPYVLWTLLFLGPLLELAGGLLVGQAPRSSARLLVYFLPLFFLAIALCTKAWVDGVLGRPYSWVKTKRAADLAPAASP